jgi:uncharacterized protein YdhG (YjbR/CyaY superfamily)
MEEKEAAPKSIDEYISKFVPEVRGILEALRQVIRGAAPNSEEKISYQMPTFALHGNLVHFAAYSKHIGFYPGSSGIAAFKHRLTEYKGAKGSVQFPIKAPLPYDIIIEIVKYRVAENVRYAENKPKKRK